MDLLYQAMRPTYQRHGLAGEPAQPAAVVDPCPPSMREPDRPTAWAVRYVPYNGGGALPDWLMEPPTRPRICVTLGSVVPLMAGVSGLSGVIAAVGQLDAEVVLALGDTNLSTLGRLPNNVRTAGWVPLSALAPTCNVIIHHGGAGTTMNALVAGVPQVVLPYGADQHMNAASVERRGVGLTHLPEESDAATVGHSLQRLLQKPAFREAANQVRQEIAAQVSPAELVPRLAEVVSCAEVFGEGKDRT